MAAMSTAEQLYDEAMQLPEQEREALAWRLWTALAPLPDEDEVISDLIDRRERELVTGTKQGVSLEESVARAIRIIRARSPL